MTLRCSVQMTKTRSSPATSCCEYGVLNRQLQAGENRDGCADRRRAIVNDDLTLIV